MTPGCHGVVGVRSTKVVVPSRGERAPFLAAARPDAGLRPIQFVDMDQYEAFARSQALYDDLSKIVDRDPEQEIQSIAIPVLDALLTACRDFVPEDPVVESIKGLMTPEAAATDSLRAVDAMLVVNQLTHALKSGLELY